MASPQNIAFHEQKRQEAVRNSHDRVKSIDQTFYRMTHSPYLKGIPYTSTGSKNALSFVNPDQSDKILGHLTGGVKNSNRPYLERLLKQRAIDLENIRLAQQNLPPVEAPIESLSEEDSLKLELATLLSGIQAFGTRSEYQKTFSENLYKIARIIIKLFPVLSNEECFEIIDNLDNLIEYIIVKIEEANVEDDYIVYTSIEKVLKLIIKMLKDLMQNINLSEKDKKALAKSYFKELINPFKSINAIVGFEQKTIKPSDLEKVIPTAPAIEQEDEEAPGEQVEGEERQEGEVEEEEGQEGEAEGEEQPVALTPVEQMRKTILDDIPELFKPEYLPNVIQVWVKVFGRRQKTLSETNFEKAVKEANDDKITKMYPMMFLVE